MSNCFFLTVPRFDSQRWHVHVHTLTQTLFKWDMCLSVSICHFYTDLHCFFSHWKKDIVSGSWGSSGLEPQEDHTLAGNHSSAIIIRMNSFWPLASGKGSQLDLAPGVLPALSDSQFSYSVPHLARVVLNKLATDHNICSVGAGFLLLLKGGNCWRVNLFYRLF